MKYVKPLTLYQQLIRINGLKKMLPFPWNRRRLVGLDMRDKYLNLAVSNPENTIAAPLCTMGMQENDLSLIIDKLQTVMLYYNVMGTVVFLPTETNPANPKVAAAKHLVDCLYKSAKFYDLKYTYWDDQNTLKNMDMDFVINHHVGIISEHLDLPEDLSKDIMDKFSATRFLQGYLDCMKMGSQGLTEKTF